MVDLNAHFDKLRRALAEEKRATEEFFSASLQLSKNEQRKQGLLLFPLKITELRTEARTEFSFRTSFPINDTYFRKGCSVVLRADGKEVHGRLLELSEYEGTVLITEEFDGDLYEEPELLFREDDRTLQCMELGLRFAGEKDHLRAIQDALRSKEEEFGSRHIEISRYVNQTALNASQLQAVAEICSEKKTVLVQGPPGTGKTTVLVSAIEQLVKNGKRVVVSAPSNTATDHLCRLLTERNIRLLRLGNDEKTAADLLPYTVDGYLDNSNNKTLLRNLSKQLKKAGEITDRHIRNYTKEAAAQKREARNEARKLRLEIRKLEDDLRAQLLSKMQVIAGTPVGLFNQLPKNFLADAVVIDEAGQAPEPLIWLTAVFGKRLVLAGDPQQLPPTVFSQKASEMGLGTSLLESAMQWRPFNLLNQQYRMSEAVLGAVNPYFYQNRLETGRHPSPGELTFIDMAGYGNGEVRNEESGSLSNASEVEITGAFLSESGWTPENTVVLSPYNAQLGELRSALPGWKISTIDAIQGQESENILISFVRSNDSGEIGFLKDYRRTNVAISRAKERCVIVGDSATLANDPFYNRLVEYIEQKGIYRSAWEFGA